MKPELTKAIVLRRTDFGEADRILTVITPDRGKLSLMARGSRKIKSKLAGGIELFSTSQVSFATGRGEVGTLMSARLIKHYPAIITDFERLQLGYELIKIIDKTTEDHPEPEYYQLLEEAFVALDDTTVDLLLIDLWFRAQLLKLAGHTPNLQLDVNSRPLNREGRYDFDFDAMALNNNSRGKLGGDHVKAMRLLFDRHTAQQLSKIEGLNEALVKAGPIISNLARLQLYNM